MSPKTRIDRHLFLAPGIAEHLLAAITSGDLFMVRLILGSDNKDKDFKVTSDHLMAAITSGKEYIVRLILGSDNKDFQVTSEHLLAAIESGNELVVRRILQSVSFKELAKNVDPYEMGDLLKAASLEMRVSIGLENVNFIYEQAKQKAQTNRAACYLALGTTQEVSRIPVLPAGLCVQIAICLSSSPKREEWARTVFQDTISKQQASLSGGQGDETPSKTE